MNNIRRRISFGLGIVSFLCSLWIGTAEAATRLTPAHLYDWARTGNITRLQQFKRYINLQDRNHNTAICLAQKAQDRDAYALLLKFGASTKVACHDDDDPICAVIAGEKTKIHPAAWWLLGAGAAAGAYLLFDDDDGGDNNPPQGCPVGYDTTIQTPTDCGSQGANGWEIITNGELDGVSCGKCIAKTCIPGTSIQKCQDGTFTKVDSEIIDGASGEDNCYRCTYACNGTTAFTDLNTCQADGYICTSVSENGQTCYRRTGSEKCPTEYPYDTPCSGGNGYTFIEDQAAVGDNTCYKCTYQCASGWTAGSCPAGKTCEEITLPDNSGKCYRNAQCPTGYDYTDQTLCETGGYICTESASGSGCWKRERTAKCPTGYDTSIQDPTDCGVGGANGWKVETNGQSGGVNCGKCIALQCDIGDTTCETAGTGFTLTQTQNGDYEGNTPCLTCTYQCASDYYETENECTNNGSYQCTSVQGHGLTCWRRGEPEQCETGSTQYQSVDDCGDSGNLGWSYSSSGMSGTLKCGICNKLSCNSGYNTAYPNAESCGNIQGWIYDKDETRYAGDEVCGKCTMKECPEDSTTATCKAGTYTKVASQNTTGYHGNDECYSCTYACNGTTAFTDLNTCQADGYICTSVSENGQTCYRRTGSEKCPTEYPYDTPCSGGNGYTFIEDQAAVGDNTCYKCTYQCASGWTAGSCPAGKTCEEITLPDNSGKCYRNAQCPTGYDYTDQTLCETGGYICTESASGSGCWKRERTAKCPTGYDTSIQDPTDCGVGGANGWKVETNGQSGGVNCGKCIALQCDIGDTTCETAGTGFTLTQTQNGDYEGNTPCLTCTYQCASDYYETENECTNNGSYQCTSVQGHGLTCWRRGEPEQCETGSTQYQSVDDCGDSGNLGWSYSSSGMSGTLKCGICNKLSCNSGYNTAYPNAESCGNIQGWIYDKDETRYAGDEVCGKCTMKECPEDSTTATCKAGTYTKVASQNTTGYHGNDECYSCTYACNGTTAFTDQSACQTGGYTCSQVEENGLTCWLRGTPSDCPI